MVVGCGVCVMCASVLDGLAMRGKSLVTANDPLPMCWCCVLGAQKHWLGSVVATDDSTYTTVTCCCGLLLFSREKMSLIIIEGNV